MPQPSIFIGLPTTGHPHHRHAIRVARIATRFEAEVHSFNGGSKPIMKTRNDIARAFMASGRDWCWWVDDDVVPPDDALENLLQTAATNDCHFVVGQYPIIQPGYVGGSSRPLSLERGWPNVGLEGWCRDTFEINACGFGCNLVSREMMAKLDWPWFAWIEARDGNDVGEDVFFARRAREAGYKILCDGRVTCEHHKEFDIGRLVKGVRAEC